VEHLTRERRLGMAGRSVRLRFRRCCRNKKASTLDGIRDFGVELGVNMPEVIDHAPLVSNPSTKL